MRFTPVFYAVAGAGYASFEARNPGTHFSIHTFLQAGGRLWSLGAL